MSDSPANFGGTLTSGIQDIAALLPLLGTEQCKKHIGSALEGGFLYAAATPLSIFGSLGIVKAGTSILIASISVPKPSWLRNIFHKSSSKYTLSRWLGAKVLSNAGFKPVGTVAPIISMDGTRYGAETELLRMLEEKHIDNPENLSIEWKSVEWNIGLVFFTLLAAGIAFVPYIQLTITNPVPSVILPWGFPLLRIFGGCVAAVCCQLLIQCRIISLMKRRIVFMVINRRHATKLTKLTKVGLWDENLPAEECLESLAQFLSNQNRKTTDKEKQDSLSLRDMVKEQYSIHFPNPIRDRVFIVTSWILLLLSLPAAIAGYIGCFTLVQRSGDSNQALVWLGLEATLSVLRVLLWAWNPTFDEGTQVNVRLRLIEDATLVTTRWDANFINLTGMDIFSLVPEHIFLKRITAYVGPLDDFNTPENTALYFILNVNKKYSRYCLFMTVLDLTNRTALTLYKNNGDLIYADTSVTPNVDTGEMIATIHWQSTLGIDHPRRANSLVGDLSIYYHSLIRALHGQTRRWVPPSASLRICSMLAKWPGPQSRLFYRIVSEYYQRRRTRSNFPCSLTMLKWSLVHKTTNSGAISETTVSPPTKLDRCFQYGYEYHLNAVLAQNWGAWILSWMRVTDGDARNYCHHALTSQKGQWECTTLDTQLVWERIRRELTLWEMSIRMEAILSSRMEEYTQDLKVLGEERLEIFVSKCRELRRRHLEHERQAARRRFEEGRKEATKRAENEGRPYRRDTWFDDVGRIWQDGQDFIDRKWVAALEHGASLIENSASADLEELIELSSPEEWMLNDEQKQRLTFVNQLKPKFARWYSQRHKERREMEDTVDRISKSDLEHLMDAYYYPTPILAIGSKLPNLSSCSPREAAFAARIGDATVYYVYGCSMDVVREVIANPSTRSAVCVNRDFVHEIPANYHLLYLGSYKVRDDRSFIHEEVTLPFIQRNRERWWQQQTSNSYTFYLSPQGVNLEQERFYGGPGTIARIMIFVNTATRVQLRLHHILSARGSVYIRKNGKDLCIIHRSDNEIPTAKVLLGTPLVGHGLKFPAYELGQIAAGRHELELVAEHDRSDAYFLHDIVVEFVDTLSEKN